MFLCGCQNSELYGFCRSRQASKSNHTCTWLLPMELRWTWKQSAQHIFCKSMSCLEPDRFLKRLFSYIFSNRLEANFDQHILNRWRGKPLTVWIIFKRNDLLLNVSRMVCLRQTMGLHARRHATPFWWESFSLISRLKEASVVYCSM